MDFAVLLRNSAIPLNILLMLILIVLSLALTVFKYEIVITHSDIVTEIVIILFISTLLQDTFKTCI